MKKLISLVLASILLVFGAVFPAFAENINSQVSHYQQKLFEHYPNTREAFEYDNLCYTEIGELDVDCDDAIDFAIIHTHFAMAPDALDGGVVGGRYIITPQLYSPFRLGYVLYDIENDKFVPFCDEMLADYPFIEEYMEEFKIGVPFGDADGDRILSVMDATYIQRVLAQLDDFKRHEELYGDLPTDYRSDFNLDGTVDIFDATGIQQKLAKVLEEPYDSV